MIRSARAWFSKAVELDEKDEVSQEFLRLVSEPILSGLPQIDGQIDDPEGSDDESVDGKEDLKSSDSLVSDDDSETNLDKIFSY